MSAKARRTRLATRLAWSAGGAALLLGGVLLFVAIAQIPDDAPKDLIKRLWMLGGIVAVVGAGAVMAIVHVQAAAIASRLNDLGLAVAKLGRGTAEVRVKFRGNDEVGALGRVLNYLAGDLQAQAQQQEKQGGASATSDAQVRALRDKTLADGFAQPPGYELDGALCKGTRGGLDYFDASVREDGGSVLFLVRGDGASAMAVVASRMARDEILRALRAGASARKALTHTNKVLHDNLPRGACAKALALELGADEIKLYQCGHPTGAFVCARGEVEPVAAEGLALGLDEGPVFEKALRSTRIPVTAGVRCVLLNEAGARRDDLAEILRQHSPKNTMAFMGLVLSAIEGESDEGGLREDVVVLTCKRSAS